MAHTTDGSALEAAYAELHYLFARARCECEHPDGDCRRQAEFRVSLVCLAEGCDGAVHVHLICGDCLAAWRENAAEDGVELRVLPL